MPIATPAQLSLRSTVSTRQALVRHHQQVNWSVEENDGGQIGPFGRYFAPFHATGTFHVVATSQADPSKSARATVTVAYEDLLDGGGPVLAAPRVFALWWGAAADFPPDMQSSLTALLSAMNGSSYLALANEYLRGATARVSFAGSLYNSSAPPT